MVVKYLFLILITFLFQAFTVMIFVSGASCPDTNSYVAEDNITCYVAENGSTLYVQE